MLFDILRYFLYNTNISEIVLIEKVTIDENGILSVKPKNESFDMIYRAAMGVRWNNVGNYLYFNAPIKQDNDIVYFYKLILRAVLEEYGKTLKPNKATVYESIDESIKVILTIQNSF